MPAQYRRALGSQVKRALLGLLWRIRKSIILPIARNLPEKDIAQTIASFGVARRAPLKRRFCSRGEWGAGNVSASAHFSFANSTKTSAMKLSLTAPMSYVVTYRYSCGKDRPRVEYRDIDQVRAWFRTAPANIVSARIWEVRIGGKRTLRRVIPSVVTFQILGCHV
jgi:hypothetical protein